MVGFPVLILDAIVLLMVSMFYLVCISHIAAGWLLRKHFQMAIRFVRFFPTVCPSESGLTALSG